jgi:hypothetical protein
MRIFALSKKSVLLFVTSALVGALVGCSEDEGKESGAEGPEKDGTDGELVINDPDTMGDGDSDGVTVPSDGTCEGLDVGGCAGEVYEGESVPLDLYLMFDQSGSMSTVVDENTDTQRIDIVRAAVRSFLRDEESVGMGAGIGYFGHQPLGETTCDPEDYRTPDVEIGALPGLEDELLGSINSAEPTGETPTGAAIRGACEYVAAYKASEGAGRNPAILFVTDGEPKAPLSEETCAPTLGDAIEAAEQCFEEEGIRVYVLGVGPSLANLNQIAEAGGTGEAYLADLDNADQVLNAFRAVRFAAQLPCELALDESAVASSELDLNASTVAYLDFECSYQAIPEVGDKDGCSESGGWYFDDAEAPSKIHLCEATCGDVKSFGRQLFYSIGCPLEVVR